MQVAIGVKLAKIADFLPKRSDGGTAKSSEYFENLTVEIPQSIMNYRRGYFGGQNSKERLRCCSDI